MILGVLLIGWAPESSAPPETRTLTRTDLEAALGVLPLPGLTAAELETGLAALENER